MGNRRRALKAVDFFCGAGGMSYGLQAAGIDVLAGIDNAADCRKTYTSNVLGAKFIKHDISTLSPRELGLRLELRRNDPDLIFAGCSPCQFWSKIRTDKKRSEKTAFLLKQFRKFIRHFNPGFVVVENVPGLHSRKGESILSDFIGFLSDSGYSWSDGVVNASSYGVPQNRMRYLLIATRLSNSIDLPKPRKRKGMSVASFIGVANGFNRIAAGEVDSDDPLHRAASLSADNLERISLTPKSGGCRDAWKDHKALQIAAYKGRDEIFRDVYGRMYWDRPAPTITTRFNSFSNGRFGHPEENRAISLREGATLQTFPKTFQFFAPNISSIARQIGNAVPPALAKHIGEHLLAVDSDG
jgi:DNA (cytosine-5)-methyltransferase 1